MEEQDLIKQALRDFVATSNSGKYKSEDELLSKFPELSSYDKGALRDFVATSNSGKYKTEDEVFSKFPEFTSVKKKEPAIGLGYEKPSEALRMGGLPKQEKLAQSPLKTAGTTIPFVSTKSALEGIKGTSTPPTGVTKIKEDVLPSDGMPPDFQKPQPRLSAEEQQTSELAATKGYVGQETEGTQLDIILANQKVQNLPLEQQMTSKEMTEQLDLLMPSTQGVEANQAFDAIFKKEGRENELAGVNETEFKKFLSATGVADKYNKARMEYDLSDKERYAVIQKFNQSIAGKSVQDLNIVKARLNSNPAFQEYEALKEQAQVVQEQWGSMGIDEQSAKFKSPEEIAQYNELIAQYNGLNQQADAIARESGITKDLQDLESFGSNYFSALLRSRFLIDNFPNILKEKQLQDKADAEYEDRRARFKKGDLSVLPTSAMYVGASAVNALNRNFYNSLASLIDNFGKLNDNTYSLGDWASKGLTELADNAIITPHKEFSKSGYNIDGYIVTKDKSGAISVFDKDFTPVQVDPNLAKKFNEEYDKKESTGAEKETMYDFFSLAPQLADQFVTMYSLVGGGRLAQVGLQSLTKRAISQNTGLTAASYLMTYEDYKKTGIENGLSDTDAHLFASISAMTTSLLEGISPNENLIPKGQAAKALEAFTASVGAPIKTRMNAVAKALVVEPSKEIIQEITQIGGDILTETGANAVLGKDVFDAATDMDEIRNTAVLTFGTTALAQLPTSGMFDTKNKKEWWQWASKDVDKLIAQVQEDVKNGLYTEEKAQIIVEKAKAWAATQGKIPVGTEDVKRAQITPLLMEKVELLETSKDLDKVFQDKINKRIDAIDKEIVGIMNKPVSEFTTEVKETTTEETDGKGTIEGAISTGTDVVEEGLGMAVEPSGEGITGEDIQAEAVPQAPLEEQQVPEVVSEKVTEVTAPAIEVTPTAEKTVTAPKVSEALKDVENTAKALELNDKTDTELEDFYKKLSESKNKDVRALSNMIDNVQEKKERNSILNSSLDKISEVVDNIFKRETYFLEKKEGREAKEVAEKYSGNVSIQDAKKDFKDAFFGNPSSWVADALKMRESVRVFQENGRTLKDLLSSVKKEFEADGFTEQDAARVIKDKLESLTKKDFRQQQLAEAYHKAKADGSNPELVKAVEELLGKPTAEAKQTTKPVAERIAEQKAAEAASAKSKKQQVVKPILNKSIEVKSSEGKKGLVPISELEEFIGEDRLGEAQMPTSRERIDSLKKDISKNGFKEPIVIVYDKFSGNGEATIIEGNHRIIAAKELGLTEIPVTFEKGTIRDNESRTKNKMFPIKRKTVGKLDDTRGITGADLGLTVRQPTDADFVKPAGETSAKEAAKPTKTERKAIAEAKIDDLAAKAKEFLRNKNLPEGTKVSGVSQNKVIDILASTVKALVNSGIEISEAIKQVRELFEQDFDTSAIKDYEINQAIAKDELTDVAKENDFSSYREAVFAVKKYVRPVSEEDVITKEEIEKAAKEKIKSEEEAKKAKSSEKKGYTGKKKVSKFYKTALAYVQNTPTRLQDFLKTNPLSYGVVTNAESIKKAIDFIQENGFEETLKDFLTKQIKTDGEFEKIIFVGYLLRGGLSEAFTDISKSMNGVTDADELAALKKEADRIFNDMKAVTTLLAEGYFPSFGRAIQAGAMFAQDLSTEDGAIFHFTKLTEQAAAKAREVNKQEATEQVDTVKEVVEEGKAKAAKEVTEYIVKSKDIQAKNTTKLSKARKAASDAKEKLKAALAKYKILGIANDPWEQAKNDVATVKALTNYVAAQLKYKSVQASQIIKEVAALLGINPRYIPKADIQEIMDAAKVQAEKDMTFDEISNATTPKGVTYAERVGKELSNDPSAINKTVESIIEDYYMGNQTTDEIIDMVKQRFDVTDAEAITIAKQIQDSINNNITKNLEKQLDKKIKQLNDKRLKEEGKKPPKERKPVKSLYDIMAQAQVMGVLDSDSIQGILEELYNVPTVTPEDIQFVKDTYAKINNTGDLTRKAQLIADLHKRFAGKNPISFYDVYNSYWYSAVLSGPSTTDVNVAYGFGVTALAIQDVISGAFINSAKIIADKFKGKQNPSSVALEARLIFDSMWRTVFQTGTLNMDAIKRGSLFKKESIPFYESVQNLVSTIKRGPQAFNEELRNTEVSAKDNAYLKDYKPQGAWGKLISPLVWFDKKTNLFSFLPKYVPRAINAVDIFFGTALKNLNLAQTLKTYYVKQGLSGKDLAKAIKSDLYKSPELLLAARELAANDRLNIDLEIKQENGEFVVYDTGKKQKSFKTKSAANKYMTELSYQGDKYQKGVVDYLNATLPPDVIDATRRIAAGYVCTGDVEGARSKWFYNNIILNIRKATMDWADSKEQSKFTRAIKFATSRVVEFMKFPLNFNNLAIAYTPALAFMRAKYTGDEASLYAQVYKDKAQQRFLTGFAAFMALTTPTLLSMLVLKSPDDEEEENKEDLKRRQELADKFFKDTGEKIDIDNPLFNLPKDGESTGSLSFLPANTKKFLKENNLAVPFRRWNAKLNIWEDYTISPLVYNLTMAASLADYVKYVINDKTKFNSVAQRAKEWQNVASYFAGNLVQTFVNAAGVKSQNQLLLTLNSNNYERKINAAVDMLFSPVQSTPALLRQLSDGLDMRLKQRVESVDKPFEYVASKTIPLGSLFYTGKKKHDMFGDEIAYLTGADRGFVLKHLFSVTQKDYEKKRTELGQFLNINGYSKYRDMITEYEKKNTEIIDIKNPTVEINGIAYTNYLDKGFTDDEMYEIGLAAAKRAKKVLLDNKVLLQEIGNATNLEEIPLISADYKTPFTESIDFIYDTIFKEEWESALVKKKYVSEVGGNVYEANKTKSTIITDMLNVILTKTPVEKIKPIETKIPIEFNDFNEGD